MNLNTVTTTDVQRSFSKILDDLDTPKVVLRDSKPRAVIIDYHEYLRMRKFEEDRLGREFDELLTRMQFRNKGIDEKKLDKLLKEALHAAGRD